MNEADRYGPNWASIVFVRDEQVRLLTEARVREIKRMAKLAKNLHQSERSALEAAKLKPFREAQAVRASEDIRQAMWGLVWDGSTWDEAWEMSWIAARAAVGLATVDLVDGTYGIDEYIDLVGPWTSGFKDHPIPREEDRAA